MDTIKVDARQVKLVAHRGVSGLETQNTASAFVAAGNRSYFGIETDVHRTADGQYVLIHDGDTAAVSDTTVGIGNATYDELKELLLNDIDGAPRSDLRIPLLSEYIRICRKYDKIAVLELKDSFTDGEIREITDIIQSLDYLDGVIFIAFDIENLVKVRALYPAQPVQFLCDTVTPQTMETLRSRKMDLDVHYKGLTARTVEQLHAAGIKINCWTVNDKEDAERLIEWGVDFITTNILE